MSRFFFWLIVLPLAVAMALFGFTNSGTVPVDLDPLPYTLDVPLYLLVLTAVFAGLIAGGASAWTSQGRWRRQARNNFRRVTQLEQELQILREKPDTSGSPIPETITPRQLAARK